MKKRKIRRAIKKKVKAKREEAARVAAQAVLEENYAKAYDFALKVYKRFKEIIKTIVLFGTVAKQVPKKESDIDIIIIVDDCTIDWDQELIAWYREELAKIIAKQPYKERIHVSTVTLTTFFDQVRIGDPVVINILRYGHALLDFGGFFEPLKVLLARGKIRATPEAVYTVLTRAPDHLAKARYNLLSSIEALYWAMVDAAHAALMAIGEIPPSPDRIPDMLLVNFVKPRIIPKKYVDWFQELYELAKDIVHGKKLDISPAEFEKQEKRAQEFLKTMVNIADKMLKEEKIIKVEKKEVKP